MLEGALHKAVPSRKTPRLQTALYHGRSPISLRRTSSVPHMCFALTLIVPSWSLLLRPQLGLIGFSFTAHLRWMVDSERLPNYAGPTAATGFCVRA